MNAIEQIKAAGAKINFFSDHDPDRSPERRQLGCFIVDTSDWRDFRSSNHKPHTNQTSASDDELRRIEEVGNIVNTLTFDCLQNMQHVGGSGSFAGLVGCCWRAKGNLWIDPTFAGESVNNSTRSFIESTLKNILGELATHGNQEIVRRALAGELRWTARAVRNQMADKIRKIYSARRRAKREQVRRDASVRPTRVEMALIAENIASKQNAFVPALGERAIATLLTIVRIWPFEETKRARKAQITSALTLRGVSPQQARADRRSLLLDVAESHDPAVIMLGTSRWFRWVFGL